MDKIEKIRQKIESLKVDYLNRGYTFVPTAMNQLLEFLDTLSEEPTHTEYNDARVDLSKFDDDIRDFGEGFCEDKPKPYWDGVYEALEVMRSWGKLVKNIYEEPDKSLEEAAENAMPKEPSYFVDEFTEDGPKSEPVFDVEQMKAMYKAGVKWGAEHLRDTTKMIDKSLDEAAGEQAKSFGYMSQDVEFKENIESFIAGAEWQKSQMLKDAFMDNDVVHDGRIELEGDPLPSLDPILILPYPQFEPGDKVKVIVLKDNEDESK